MTRDDEEVLAICNPITAKELGLSDEAAVQTGLLSPNEIYVVPKDEFLDWLKEGGQTFMS